GLHVPRGHPSLKAFLQNMEDEWISGSPCKVAFPKHQTQMLIFVYTVKKS
ncbi:hypothetical protein X975_10790, partial [Stegodyphus mimosarum]